MQVLSYLMLVALATYMYVNGFCNDAANIGQALDGRGMVMKSGGCVCKSHLRDKAGLEIGCLSALFRLFPPLQFFVYYFLCLVGKSANIKTNLTLKTSEFLFFS